jgi:hypothetical protein
MSIAMCVRKQAVCFMEHRLICVLMNGFIFNLNINGEKMQRNLPSNWLMQYGTKVKRTSFCCKDLNVTLDFLFYVCFLLNNSVCVVKAKKSIWRTPLRHITRDSDLLLCVSLASASEWRSAEHGIKQLTAETDAHSSEGL